MLPTLVGYFPKRTELVVPHFLRGTGVVDIASVSECMSKGPEDWIDKWLHNDWGFFPSPDVARRVVPSESAKEFDFYAYELFPVTFVDGVQELLTIADSGVAPLDATFKALGYDIVAGVQGVGPFDCSPLSCNSLAAEEPVNKHCLLDSLEAALSVAATCEERGCEPGPYFVFRVWRQRPAV